MEVPPFCPRQGCPCHIDPSDPKIEQIRGKQWWKRNGFYYTEVRGAVRRFKCLVCRHGFSEQTFRLDYYVKRTIDYQVVSQTLSECVSVRGCSRLLGCSCDSVTNRVSRLARQCIAAHSRLLATLEQGEDLVADGFESFTVSQYFPNNIHLLVGKKSQLLYFCDYVTIRRNGRMTDVQKRMRTALEALYRAPVQALTSSFAELLQHLLARLSRCSLPCLRLHTDKKQEYLRAIGNVAGVQEAIAAGTIAHQRTDSRAARTRANPLFAVNYLDRELRKDLAEHVRETVRFARNVNHCMERLWVYAHRHNFEKRFRVNDGVGIERRHVLEAGAESTKVEHVTRGLTRQRRFLSFESLEAASRRVWCREHLTPLKGVVRGALRAIKRQALRGEVDLEAIRTALGVERLVRDVPQYLPQYALA